MMPQRMCIVCRTRRDKQDFLRIVKQADGKVIVDDGGKLPGRGAYICNNRECIEKAIKKRQLSRAFKGAVEDAVYESLGRENDEEIRQNLT